MRLFFRFLRALVVLTGRSSVARTALFLAALPVSVAWAMGFVVRLAVGDIAIIYVKGDKGEAGVMADVDRGVFKLEQYVRSSDCDANGRNCDLYPAFQTAMAACSSLRLKQNNNVQNDVGCVYLIPEGKHRLTRTVKLCRQNTIRGTGTWNPNSSTVIWSDDTAFWIRSAPDCGAANLGTNANTTMTGVSLQASFVAQANAYGNCTARGTCAELGVPEGTPCTTTDTCGVFGVLADSTFTLEHMSIQSYTQAIHAFCSSGGFNNNCNLWSLQHIWVSATEHSGIFIRGLDANSGIGHRLNVSEACANGTVWNAREIWKNPAPQEDCAGIHDRSFLGNTWIGIHTTSIRDIVQNPQVAFHSYKMDGEVARTVCIGCYAEHDSLKIEAQPGTTFIGADAKHSIYDSADNMTKYLHIDGQILSPFAVRNFTDLNNRVVVLVGATPGAVIQGVPLNADQQQSNAYVHLKYDLGRQSWVMGASDSETATTRSMSIAADATSTDGGMIGELRIECDFAPAFIGFGCT
jgi:hypothetical protein